MAFLCAKLDTLHAIYKKDMKTELDNIRLTFTNNIQVPCSRTNVLRVQMASAELKTRSKVVVISQQRHKHSQINPKIVSNP